MMQRPPEPSDTSRSWKRRQQRLLILLAVLMMIAVLLVARGVMLLPSGNSGAVQAHQATATATATVPPRPTAPTPTPPPAPSIQAAASMLVNTSDGTVLFQQNADAPLPMASTTKIMTALLALQYGKLNQQVTIGADAVAAGLGENSHMGVSQGETLSLGDLLYGLMVKSGDDAAVAIADAISGDQQTFVDLMNARARFLSLTHTHYANPHGLDAAGHYTSASDLIKLTEIAMRLPMFDTLVSTQEYVIPATDQHKSYDLQTTNALLGASGYAGADGVKTGTTGNAGWCLVFSALRSDAHLLGVVLGAPDDPTRYSDAHSLLDWGFTVVNGSTGG